MNRVSRVGGESQSVRCAVVAEPSHLYDARNRPDTGHDLRVAAQLLPDELERIGVAPDVGPGAWNDQRTLATRCGQRVVRRVLEIH
jgi:hypothetical protein